MTLKELGTRINAHLKRLEGDKAWNEENCTDGNSASHFYNAGSWYAGGNRLLVQYKSYHGQDFLTKAEAEAYLKKLDNGFKGRHFEALREKL